MTGPKESRPANASLFGKRTERFKGSIDPETAAISRAKARALGYATWAEFLSDVITANARGVDLLAKVHADRLERAVAIGPVLDHEEDG